MELRLEPERPKRYTAADGRSYFNKGVAPHNKGKKLEELYGKERAEEIREKFRLNALRNRAWENSHGCNHHPVVLIIDGRLAGRFESIHDAGRKMGVNYRSIHYYLKKGKSKNGWTWFLENDERWMEYLE